MLSHHLVEDLKPFYSFEWPAVYVQEDEVWHPDLYVYVDHLAADLLPTKRHNTIIYLHLCHGKL